jgi:hypothetical protein
MKLCFFLEGGVLDACVARNGLKSLLMHVAGCDRDLHRFEVAVGAVTGKNIRIGRAGLERPKHIWMQGTKEEESEIISHPEGQFSFTGRFLTRVYRVKLK